MSVTLKKKTVTISRSQRGNEMIVPRAYAALRDGAAVAMRTHKLNINAILTKERKKTPAAFIVQEAYKFHDSNKSMPLETAPRKFEAKRGFNTST